ncbi:MAG: polysaccharide biosynthesis tyrosine autokinase [Bacteroidota bacterium]
MNDYAENNDYENKKTVIDPNKIFAILLRRWYVIALSVLICLSVTYIQLRYTKPLYRASITLKLDDEKPSQISDLFKYGRASGKFDNFLKTESEALRSRHYAEKTLETMQMEYSYFVKGNFVTTQLYPNPYFKIITVHLDSSHRDFSFNLEYLSGNSFKIVTSQNKKNEPKHALLDTFNFEGNLLTVVAVNSTRSFNHNFGSVICHRISYPNLAPSFAGNINVDVVKGTSLVTLQFTHEEPLLASDYLNALAKFYVGETVNNKSLAAQQTIDFIDKQLMDLASKVQKNEFELSDLRSKNNGIEIDAVANTQVQKLAALEAEKNILLIKQDMVAKLQKSILESKDGPVSFVVFDKEDAENIPNILEAYNDLVLTRVSILQRNTPQSSVAIENETRIRETRNMLLQTVKSFGNKLNSRITYTNTNIAAINEILGSIPMRQRMMINIQRDFKVNEKVYTYLFEKKLETSISKSSITPNASIIEASQTPSWPISPNKNQAYSFAWLLGLGIGIGIIVFSRIIYQKIPDKETIESISNIPVLGVVKKIQTEDNEYDIYTFKNPKSVFSESIRGIRTGLSFISKGKEHKVICVTSTVSGEGKTFCSINLAASFTLLNKKVIIIGCDLRRPKVHLSFSNITNSVGLTTFLIGKSSLAQTIQHTEYPNLDVITAGPTPPNPAELLQTDEMVQLLETLRSQYDYILIDSAPVGLVSDSLIIMGMSDINLYVIRSQYSRRDFAQIPDRLKTDSSIQNIYTILNAYDNSSIIYSSIYKNDYGGYYSGSGYYYYGGYYGKGGYGYYGKKYNDSYYSGYYSEDEDEEQPTTVSFLKGLFKRKNKK